MAIIEDFKWEDGYQDGPYHIPMRMMGSLRRYIETGELPGDFLMAVIKHDLFNALHRADLENLKNIIAYTKFLHNVAPPCHGSEARMLAWSEAGGFNALKKGGPPAWDAMLRREAELNLPKGWYTADFGLTLSIFTDEDSHESFAVSVPDSGDDEINHAIALEHAMEHAEKRVEDTDAYEHELKPMFTDSY